MDSTDITNEMTEAGELVLLGELGGAITSHWDAPDLANRVYSAMNRLRSGSGCVPDSPTAIEAFEILVERMKPPEGRDTPAYRRLCRAVIDEHIDRVEVARTGKPMMWPEELGCQAH